MEGNASMKSLLVALIFILAAVPEFSSASFSSEKLKTVTTKCLEEVSGMEKAFMLESEKYPLPAICERLQKEDGIGKDKCLSFFEQKKEAEAVVDFSNAEEAYMILFEACIETAIDETKK